MGLWEIFLIGVGLSMDAFAVSVCKGLAMSKVNKKHALIIGLFFGGFQALMPLLGYYLGDLFYKYIIRFGPIISCLLLVYIGGKLVLDGIKERNENEESSGCDPKLSLRELFILAIATSIDAFAVGVTFVLLSVNIFKAIIIIGLTTFVISVFAVFLGNIAGIRYRTPARILGGIVLIFLGFKILIEAFM